MSDPVLPIPNSVWHDDGSISVTCPQCGYADDLQCFDCIGADPGFVFCNQCQLHFELITAEWKSKP